MFTKISKNLIVFGIVVLSFVFANNAYARTYAFSGEPTGEYGFIPSGDLSSARNLYNVNNRYSYPYYNTNTNSQSKTSTSNSNPSVVNNYYYNNSSSTKTTESSTSKTTTSQTAKNTTSNSNSSAPLAKEVSGNANSSSNGIYRNLGASAYGSGSYGDSSDFMPDTFFEWLLVILLILAIIVVYRMIIRNIKKSKETPKTV